MNIAYHYQHVLMLLSELYQSKCEEVNRLIRCKKYSPRIIEIRQQEADKLKEILQEITKVHPMALNTSQLYNKLHNDLASYFEADPQLSGGIIILGLDKPGNFQRFFRHPWNIPISLFRN